MEVNNCLIIGSDDLIDSTYFSLLNSLPFLEFRIYGKNEEVLKYIYSKQKVDLIMIDASLGEDFLDFFFKNIYVSLPVIVMCESYKQVEHVLKIANRSIEILLFPFDRSSLLAVLGKTLKMKHSETSVADSDSVFLKCGRSIKRFFFDRIEYIEAYGAYSKIFYKGSKIVVNENISNLEHLLSVKKFRRVHKSYIVNIDNIEEVDSKGMMLIDRKERIPFGPKYRTSLAGLFKSYYLKNILQ